MTKQKELVSRLVKVAGSLEDVSQSYLEEMDRISPEDLESSKTGDHKDIDEGSAMEKVQSVLNRFYQITSGQIDGIGNFERHFIASQKSKVSPSPKNVVSKYLSSCEG